MDDGSYGGDPGPSSRLAARTNLFQQEGDDDDDDIPLFGQRTSDVTADKNDRDSLYSLLNVPKDATVEQITAHYRSFVVLYHPDKQRSPENKAAAEVQFRRIQKAYEVLTDPHLRAAYDALGEEGLTSGLEVGQKLKTPEELRAEYTKQAQEKKALLVQRLVNAKGSVSLSVDAQALLAPSAAFFGPRGPQDASLPTRLKFVQAKGLALVQSWQAPLGDATMLEVTGTMSQRAGAKRSARLGGNLIGTVRSQWTPKMFVEVSTAIITPQVLATRLVYEIDEETSLDVSTRTLSPFAPPTVDVSLHRLLTPNLKSWTTFRSGFWTLGPWGQSFIDKRADESALSIGLTSLVDTSTVEGGWTGEVEVGPGDASVSVDWSKHVWSGWEVKVGGSVGFGGMKGFLTWARKITELIKLTMSVEAELATGLTLKLRLYRLGQSISLPITLIRKLDYPPVLIAALLPCVAIGTLQHTYLGPRRRKVAARRWRELQEENREMIDQLRKEAEETVRMLQPIVDRRKAEEVKTDGLIILSATYGALKSFSSSGLHSSETGADHIDVTCALQALVQDSQLVVPPGRPKSGLLGFFDPALGRKKILRMRYTFRGRLHEVTVDDAEGLLAPIREHAIE